MKRELTAHIRSTPGKSSQLKAAIQKLVAETIKEDGCIEFKVFQDDEDENHFILWEIFANQQALDLHMKQDYTKHYFNCGFIEQTKAVKHTEI